MLILGRASCRLEDKTTPSANSAFKNLWNNAEDGIIYSDHPEGRLCVV